MSSIFSRMRRGAKEEKKEEIAHSSPIAIPPPPVPPTSSLQPPTSVPLSSSPTRSSTVPPPLPPSPSLQPLPPLATAKPSTTSPPIPSTATLVPPNRPPLPASPPARTGSLTSSSSAAPNSAQSPPSPQPLPPPQASWGFWGHPPSPSPPAAGVLGGRTQSLSGGIGGRGPVPPTHAQSLPQGVGGPHHYPTATNLSPSSSLTSIAAGSQVSSPSSLPIPAASSAPSEYKQGGGHEFTSFPAMSAGQGGAGGGSTMLDDVCRLAMSWDIDDQLLAARLFLEQTQQKEERALDELVSKAMGVLLKLMASANASVQTHAIQTIALLARNVKYHPVMQAHGYIQKLLDQLQLCRDARVLEALLAALTHLAKSHSACTIICERGYASLLPLLDMKHVSSVGVQCNTLALIGALAAYTSLQDFLINHDILHALYVLRDSHTQADIHRNAQFCLQMMGYTDEDPTKAHLDILNAAVSMGFPRGRCEAAIHHVKMNRGHEAADDMQAVSTYLLDHSNEPPPAALIAVGGGAELNRSVVTDPPSTVSSEERRHEAALRKERELGVKRVAKERADDVSQLLEIGFTRKEAILSLYYQNTRESAIEWIFKRRAFKEKRQRAGAAHQLAGAGRDYRHRVEDDEEDGEAKEEVERERSASNKESGYDSDGLYISEFDDDDAGAGERKRSGDDDQWESRNSSGSDHLAHTSMARTASVPPPAGSHPAHSHHAGACSDPALPGILPHNRSQSSLPSGSPLSGGPGTKYATLPSSIPSEELFSRAAPSSASVPTTPTPLSPSNDPRRAQEKSAMMAWLSSNNLQDYSSAFTEQQISVATLHMLTDNDLKDLGMKRLGDRRKFQQAVQQTADIQHRAREDRQREDKKTNSQSASTSTSAPQTDGPTEEDILPVSDLRPQSPIESWARAAAVAAVAEGDAAEHARDEEVHDHVQVKASNKGFVHFAFLQSMPLRHSEVPGISKKLDLSKETMELQAALNESGKQFRVGWEIATKDNLLKMMSAATHHTAACTALASIACTAVNELTLSGPPMCWRCAGRTAVRCTSVGTVTRTRWCWRTARATSPLCPWTSCRRF